MKYDIFISYSRKDFEEVNQFVNMLKQQIPTLTYWFDITGIESGDEFEEKIIDAINNSSYVLFALSNNSIQSKWTKDEVNYAKNTGKKVIPVLLKGAKLNDGWFLFKFGRTDCIDLTNSLQVEKLIKNLSDWIGKSTILKEEQSHRFAHKDAISSKESKQISLRLLFGRNKGCLVGVSILMLLIVILFPNDYFLYNEDEILISDKNNTESSNISFKGNHDILKEDNYSILTEGDYVDLGLSVKWASCNVGASSPEESGGYYSWGEIVEKDEYTIETYKYIYTEYGYTQTKKIATDITGTDYDVAKVVCGSNYRIPTREEMKELIQKCEWRYFSINQVDGMLVTGKNGNSIFIPSVGYKENLSTHDVCYYWTSTADENGTPYCLWFSAFKHNQEKDLINHVFVENGLVIRPVVDK